MPDLTIEIMQQCESLSCRQYDVGDYIQNWQGRGWECTCKAYKFSKANKYGEKTCKHITQALHDRCGWHEQWSDERQTDEQAEKCVCPRCGGPTKYVRVAV